MLFHSALVLSDVCAARFGVLLRCIWVLQPEIDGVIAARDVHFISSFSDSRVTSSWREGFRGPGPLTSRGLAIFTFTQLAQLLSIDQLRLIQNTPSCIGLCSLPWVWRACFPCADDESLSHSAVARPCSMFVCLPLVSNSKDKNNNVLDRVVAWATAPKCAVPRSAVARPKEAVR